MLTLTRNIDDYYFDQIDYFIKGLTHDFIFETEPIDFDIMLYDRKYLNLPKLSDIQYNFLKSMSDINPKTCQYTRAVLEWGKGSGKDWISANLGLILVYKLECIEDPYFSFNLASDSHIDLLNVAYSAAQANNVYFKYLKTKAELLEDSDMFSSFNNFKIGKNVIDFEKRISFYSGHSDQESWEGLNLFFAFADEISSFDVDEKKQKKKRVASIMWDMLDDSVYSRFPSVGKLIGASYPRYKNDFIELLIEIAKDTERKQKQRQLLNYFYYSFAATWEVNLTKTRADFARKYELNPEDARAKFECLPPMMLDAFYRDPQKINNCFVNYSHPIDSLGRWKSNFIGKPNFNYFVRYDLSKNKDATGMAMVHVDRYTNDERPIVKLDVIRRYLPKKGQDINYAEIRNDLFALIRKGFNIINVSFDQFGSIDFVQILNKRNISTSVFSVDRNIKAHTTLKNLVYDRRIELYKDGDGLLLANEMKTLRLIEGKKVDHPINGSKDLVDAVAGACEDALANPETFIEVSSI